MYSNEEKASTQVNDTKEDWPQRPLPSHQLAHRKMGQNFEEAANCE